MQITVTDHNNWEGEDFSFVLEIDNQLATEIKKQASHSMRVELNTTHTPDDIERINKHSDNGYMCRIGFYEINPKIDTDQKIDFYEIVFYKGIGLVTSQP